MNTKANPGGSYSLHISSSLLFLFTSTRSHSPGLFGFRKYIGARIWPSQSWDGTGLMSLDGVTKLLFAHSIATSYNFSIIYRHSYAPRCNNELCTSNCFEGSKKICILASSCPSSWKKQMNITNEPYIYPLPLQCSGIKPMLKWACIYSIVCRS